MVPHRCFRPAMDEMGILPLLVVFHGLQFRSLSESQPSSRVKLSEESAVAIYFKRPTNRKSHYFRLAGHTLMTTKDTLSC